MEPQGSHGRTECGLSSGRAALLPSPGQLLGGDLGRLEPDTRVQILGLLLVC